MKNYSDTKYTPVRREINELFETHNNDVNLVKLAGLENNTDFNMYLSIQNKSKKWNISKDDWNSLVDLEFETRSGYIHISEINTGVIFSTGETNDQEINNDYHSNWSTFKSKKLDKLLNFNSKTIENIENDTVEIMKRLSVETEQDNPVKGLVIGGVQSGKTTNIASLMAMIGDQEYNMVIILSGTIENLRLQTEARIQELLDSTNRKRGWRKIERPKNTTNNLLENIHNHRDIFYSVVLKNKTRLEDLITWLTTNENYSRKLSILIIDDEADQGSINTSKDRDMRNTINRLIVNLVHGRKVNGEKLKYGYKSVNYIAYTATPYANILSESPGGDSLYPKNFISILSESEHHFGPKEIFGLEVLDDAEAEITLQYEPLDIIRPINNLKEIREILSEELEYLTIDLKESLSYFIAASASLRKHNFGKPVSMLIHVSNRIKDHEHIYELIKDWLIQDKDEVLELTKKVWNDEIGKLSISDIKEKVSININNTLRPHNYEDILEEINEIIKDISPINIDVETKDHIYHTGIHTILDHSRANKNAEYNEEFRLNYPRRKEDLKNTPVFIVIGGATLSRGLTLEGLITSFFLRTPSTADTLIQMGRWFGYRINYELYPRIWLTNKTRNQFSYVSQLEYELREDIDLLKKLGVDYSQIAPKIKYSPQYINLVSKNKSSSMIGQEYDFTGYKTQTYIFDADVEIQKFNYELTKKFINSLGKPNYLNHENITAVIWNDIKFETIFEDLLNDFKFNSRIKALNSLDNLYEWVAKTTNDGKLQNFNIILGGKGKINQPENDWVWDNFSYNKVNRSKLVNKSGNYDEINIKALRDPKNLYLDIDTSKIKDENLLKLIKEGATSNYNFIRNELKMEKIPQLFIYNIKGDSKATSDTRIDLNFDSDIIGIEISIPSGDKTKNYITHVTVSISDVGLDDIDMDSLEE